MNRNEKKVLEELSKNARAKDSNIAKKLGITIQAVGKIRKKLETEGVIESYNVRINPNAIGLNLINILVLRFPPEIVENEEIFRKEIEREPHVINCYRLLHGDSSLLLVYAFKNLEESETYFKKFYKKHPDIRIVNMQTTTWNVVWKNTKKDVYLQTLQEKEKK